MSQERLHREIIARSEADTWDKARSEWDLKTIHISDDPEVCLCGHNPIREICTIHNRENGAEVDVGNCCVNHFLGLESEKLFVSIRKLKYDAGASLNQDAIEYAFSRRIITEWEYGFYLDIWRKRKLSKKQLDVKNRINAKVMAAVTR